MLLRGAPFKQTRGCVAERRKNFMPLWNEAYAATRGGRHSERSERTAHPAMAASVKFLSRNDFLDCLLERNRLRFLRASVLDFDFAVCEGLSYDDMGGDAD